MQTRTLAWLSFWFVALIWGSSFLLIRVGVGSVSPGQLVFIRTAIAAVGLNAVLLLQGRRLPTDWKTIRSLFLIGLGNGAFPYMLLALGEQSIESNLASVLQATASMFTLVFAHFVFHDERITTRKLIGLALGFSGVLVLASRSQGDHGQNSLIGQLCIVGASLFYAIFAIYSRKMLKNNVPPMVISAGTMLSAAFGGFVLMTIEPLLGGRSPVPLADLPQDALFAVLALGFFNTFIAYLFFYFIIQELGAFRATMVTYVVPVVGVTLGWLVLNESMDVLLLAGGGLIFAGIAVINLRREHLYRLRLVKPQTPA